MALANLYPQKLGEWKTEMEERRDREAYWSNMEVTEEDESEEDEEEEEEGEEEGEYMQEGKEMNEMMVKVDEEESDVENKVREDEEGERKVQGVEESEEEEEEEESEEDDGENEVKREVNGSDEEDKENGGVKEGEEEEENEEEEEEDSEVMEGEQVEGSELAFEDDDEEEQREHEHPQRFQEEAVQEGENILDSVKFDDEDSNLTEFEDKKEKDANDCCSFEGRQDEERDVDPEKGERYQNLLQEEEEESTDDDEGAEYSVDEDSYDENVQQIYSQEDHPLHLFQTLTEFRESSILTDLSLISENGDSLNVHSCVLAAVSRLIRDKLRRRDAQEIKEDKESIGIHRWFLDLDVDHVGLQAVVEFAYTGLVSCLNRDTVVQIKAAAKTLGAPRVLDLCTKEDEKPTTSGAQVEEEEEEISAEEQVMISLEVIKLLWTDRVGCDVILKTLKASVHVHRVILAAGSDYFRGMFTLGMRESVQPCVTLPFLMASELEVLIGCSYSGTVPLSWSRVFEIIAIAIQLQYQPALTLCLDFLQKEINPHSCLDVASFAEAYDMAPLLEVAEDFILRQFQKVACTSKFKDLPAKKLFKYLNSSSLCVPSELVVFKAVVAWIQAKPKRRLKLAKELMKTVHFPLMTFKEFREVQYLSMWSDHSLEELYEAVFEDFCSNDTALQSQCRVYLPKESLVLIGGDQILEDLGRRCISKELWFGNSLLNHTGIKKAMEWRRLGEIPESARFRHHVAVFKGQLYVFGGKMYYGKDDTLDSVLRYDPVHNSWETLARMQEKRCAFSVVVLDENIYAIGGHCDPDYSESVEQYSPAANTWGFTQPLDLPLSAHVAKVLHGKIFISGGLNSDYQCLSSMFLYHPETGSNYLANMNRPRAHHCMETMGGHLYVAGGITTNDNMVIIDHLDCEVYSPAADCWTAIASLPVPHVGAGSVVLEGKFYVLGGYSQEDFSDTKMIHRYDPSLYRWENMGKMPGPNNNIGACLLCLPAELRS